MLLGTFGILRKSTMSSDVKPILAENNLQFNHIEVKIDLYTDFKWNCLEQVRVV